MVLQEYLKGAAVKRDNIAKMLLHLEASEQLIAEEEKRLNQRRMRLCAASERLESYLLTIMARHGYKKLEGELFTLKLHQSPKSIGIVHENQSPPELLLEKPPPRQIDRKAVLTVLKEGKDLPGARLVTDSGAALSEETGLRGLLDALDWGQFWHAAACCAWRKSPRLFAAARHRRGNELSLLLAAGHSQPRSEHLTLPVCGTRPFPKKTLNF